MSTTLVVFFCESGKEEKIMSLADNIRHYRERKNITQKELAETVGITQQALSLFEQGVKVPGIITAVDIAKTLDTTVEQLVDGQTEE